MVRLGILTLFPLVQALKDVQVESYSLTTPFAVETNYLGFKLPRIMQ